jgi:putative flippase GtrA
MKIALLYALLAAIATAVNIGSQDAFLRMYNGPWHVLASVIFGTAIGLLFKYVLDKRFIFHFQARDAAHDSRTFVLYTAMGLLTTLVFWCLEFGFHVLFEGSREMRYLGGALGLAIGYATKYQLDKRYVFKAAQ